MCARHHWCVWQGDIRMISNPIKVPSIFSHCHLYESLFPPLTTPIVAVCVVRNVLCCTCNHTQWCDDAVKTLGVLLFITAANSWSAANQDFQWKSLCYYVTKRSCLETPKILILVAQLRPQRILRKQYSFSFRNFCVRSISPAGVEWAQGAECQCRTKNDVVALDVADH